MQNKVNTNIERIIAKIDNDFNPDNSDWIPRVGAWCIDAMSQLDVLRTKRTRRKINVKDRIAYSNCPIDTGDIKVFDSNGCEIKEAKDSSDCIGCPSTGEATSETSGATIKEFTPDTIDIVDTGKKESTNHVFAETVNDKFPYRYNVVHSKSPNAVNQERNYVVVDCNKLELNYDANFIYIESEQIETVKSDMFNCEMPVIPNNGILIEAIAYYCIYKMLCRGYKHPVFNLAASQYGTNPYYEWNKLKDEAKRSIINGSIDEASKLFRSSLFIQTFDPRF